jgi:hypothetical protein
MSDLIDEIAMPLEPKGLSIAEIKSARKARGEPVPSNVMMPTWKKSEGKR